MAAPKGNQYAKGKAVGRHKMWDDDAIENEAQELKIWADNDLDLWIKDFAHLRGYSPQRFYEWRDSNKAFAEAFEYAKDKQERKFYMGAMKKDLDMVFVKYFMPRVLKDRPEWKAAWDAAEETKEATPSTIIINKIEK
jgi:hypothetical protein